MKNASEVSLTSSSPLPAAQTRDETNGRDKTRLADASSPSHLPTLAQKLHRAAGSQSLSELQSALTEFLPVCCNNDKPNHHVDTTKNIMEDSVVAGKNPVHMAAWRGCLRNLQYLVEDCGCDVNQIATGPYSYGKTPLFFATTRFRNDVAAYLLDRGAHVCIVNNKGQSVRSLAASHLNAALVERICQLESAACSSEPPWINYRTTHSDGLEYGDLDPRFLDRPLRGDDVVTEHAVNPTTKQSRRRGIFYQRNPHLHRAPRKDKPKSRNKDNKKDRKTNLSLEEQARMDEAWTRLVGHVVLSFDNDDCLAQTTFDHIVEDLYLILSTMDQLHRPWIPEVADRLLAAVSSSSSAPKMMVDLLEKCRDSNQRDQVRETLLLQKILQYIRSQADSNTTQQSPMPLPTYDAQSPNTTSQYRPHPLENEHPRLQQLREDHEWRHSILAHTDVTHKDRDGPVRLLHKPHWIDHTSDLSALRAALELDWIVAMDTEWADRSDQVGATTIVVATLQLAFPQTAQVFVVDMMTNAECQGQLRTLVQQLFSPPRLVVGFAMSQDLEKLRAWGLQDLDSSSVCLDLQPPKAGQPPGLARVVQAEWPSRRLPKTWQRSDWSQRPLSQEQLEYAGLDAAVLLPLLQAKLVLTDEET